MNALPAGYSDEENDFDEFDDFSYGDYPTKNGDKIYGSNLGKERKSPVEEMPVMEQLKFAIFNGSVEIVKSIIKSNVEIVKEELCSLLLDAASVGHAEIIEILIENGADPNSHEDLYTPLMAVCACAVSRTDTLMESVIILYEAGALCTSADRYAMTPLMYASRSGHAQLVEYLLHFSAIEAEDTQGWTALFFAVSANHLDVINLLLNEGAKVGKRDVRGCSVRQLAIDKGFMDVADLVASPSDLDFPSYDELEINNTLPKWSDMLPGLVQSDVPAFFDEVVSFMLGIDARGEIAILQDHKIDFPSLLSLSDGDLETMGILLPYDRRRILQNVHALHIHRWHNRTLPSIPKDDLFSVYDVLSNIGVANKHCLIISSTFKFLRHRLTSLNSIQKKSQAQNSLHLSSGAKNEICLEVQNLRERIAALKKTANRLKTIIKQIEINTTPPADCITTGYAMPKGVLKKKLLFFGILSATLIIGFRKKQSLMCLFNKITCTT